MSGEPVVVIGAGQAGLAVSRELTAAGVDHVVLERARIGETWRGRWDSFCLVTPNWTMALPAYPYSGPDPDGFLHRDRIVDYLESFSASFAAPVRQGIDVSSLEPGPRGAFLLKTTDGEMLARTVVLATGAYQKPYRPPIAGTFPSTLLVMDAEGYTNPGALPDGRVLVVGSGQTGCQIAEELHDSGRDVFLSCGRAPWLPRRVGGRDIFRWLTETDFFEAPLSSLPSPLARLAANPQLSGHDGGHDLNYRTLQAMGVQLLGHLAAVDGSRAVLEPDLAESVAMGDARYRELRQMFVDRLGGRGLETPELPDPPPFEADMITELSLEGFGAVIFTAGFRPDFTRWVHFPAFDEMGFPIASECASSVVPGLFFAGVHFLRKRKSSLLLGVSEDAAVVAEAIAGRRRAAG